MSQPAVFLDRDDTLTVDSGFIDHPDKVSLMPGAIEAVRRIRDAGYRVVIATNQSGIARGYFDEARLRSIHERLQQLLREGGQRLDGIYYCPYLAGPEANVEAFRKDSELRKPAPGMLLQAARELGLDLSRSWMIGDAARDIEAGRNAGCRTILIDRNGRSTNGETVRPDHRTRSLLEAVMIVEQETARDADSPDDNPNRNAGSLDDAPNRNADSPDDNPNRNADPTTQRLLTEIRDLLDRQNRATLQDDFSLRRLLATLVQMLALVVAAWGLYALFTEQGAAALTRFALAGLLQLIMISLTLTDQRR